MVAPIIQEACIGPADITLIMDVDRALGKAAEAMQMKDIMANPSVSSKTTNS